MSDSSPVAAGDATATGRARRGADERTKTTIFAAGGVLGAIAATSCCILPLALFSLGISGVWIGNLAALTPYQPFIILVTAGFLGYGFYRVYWKPQKAYADGSACARPLPNRIVKSALWVATVLVAAAVAFPYVAPALLGY